VLLDRDRNVTVMATKPSISKYTAFVASVESLEPTVCCFVATGVPQSTAVEVTDDEDSDVELKSLTAMGDMGDASLQEDKLPNKVDLEGHTGAENVSVEREEPMDKDNDEMY
jgi:hypothetical protein